MAEMILNTLIEIINKLGYAGILCATGLEYACFPVSSELLLPFIGYTVSKGQMSLVLTILTSTLGGIMGCLFCYMIGRFGGNFLNRTLCRRFKSADIGISRAVSFFRRHGSYSVMFGRVFPIVRTYISIPAGIAKMNVLSFVTYTAIGAFVWNTVLISMGFFLGEHWQTASVFFTDHKWTIIIVLLLLFFIIFYRIRGGRNKRRRKK